VALKLEDVDGVKVGLGVIVGLEVPEIEGN